MSDVIPEQAGPEEPEAELDVDDVEADPVASEHATSRLDNLTGTDAEGGAS